jgi:hypothetical protein
MLLLPWYVNQSMANVERQQVEEHLRSCLLCRRELVVLRKLAAAVKQCSELDVAAEASFAGLLAKMQSTAPTYQPSASVGNQPLSGFKKHVKVGTGLFANTNLRHRLMHYLGSTGTRLAIVASLLLAMAPLVMQHQQLSAPADYYTLSAAKPELAAGPRLRVVFSKSLPDSGIDSLLAQIRGQREAGPNTLGAYTVKLDVDKDSPDVTAAIAFLRSQPDVMLAEPVPQP